MTLTGPEWVSRLAKLMIGISSVLAFNRGCNAGNTRACRFGSTLALHSIEFWAIRIVVRALQ